MKNPPRLRAVSCVALFLWCVVPALADRVVVVAGGGSKALPAPAAEARLREPFGVDFDRSGNLWIVEMVSGNRLLQLDPTGTLHHRAGTLDPGFSGDGGPGLEAKFNGPHNLGILSNGNVLVGDTWNGRIREFKPRDGTVESVRGYEVALEKAKGSGPYCITVDGDGKSVYIADLRQVWRFEFETGERRLVAGNGRKGKPVDGGRALNEPLVDPRAVAPDRLGNVYILERGGNALRVVDKEGSIRTVVNASGMAGSEGDGGPALEAKLNGPKHLCVDRDNTVLIADAENHLVRRYVPATGRIERVAGTGKRESSGVGDEPTACGLARPHGVTVHPQTGEIYITDSYNDRILKIVKD
jgi:DNA-binding beta-propeller fold protein YncE